MSPVFIACAVVAAVSALIATVAAHKCAEQLVMVRQICSTLSAERGRIATHDAELDQITDTLRKLSGRIGAARKEARNAGSSGEPADVSDINRLTWKAQMREKYGVQSIQRS